MASQYRITNSRTISDSAYVWTPDVASTEDYDVNGLNQYTTVNGTTVDHDDNGNLTGWNGWTYTYDILNRLTTASKDGHAVGYRYDPLGRLYRTTDNGVVTEHLYDGVEPISDFDGQGRLLRRYINGAGVDERVLYLSYNPSNGGYASRWYYRTDHQGSVIAMIRNIDDPVQKYAYDEYGNLTKGEMIQPFGYTGRRHDETTGLYYYRARWYNPSIGRFMQTDPIGYQDDMNMYAYVGNDPMNKVDPTGEAGVFGFAFGFIADVASQVILEGKDLGDVDLVSATASGALGATGAGLVSAGTKLFKAAKKVKQANDVAKKRTYTRRSSKAKEPKSKGKTGKAELKAKQKRDKAITDGLSKAKAAVGVNIAIKGVKENLGEVTVNDPCPSKVCDGGSGEQDN